MPGDSEEMLKIVLQDIEFMRKACLLCDNSVLEVRTGCVIVSKEGVVLGEGWNYPTFHAEQMALEEAFSSGFNTRGAIVYVTRFPCEDCAKKLIEAKISKLFYMSDHFSSGNSAISLFESSNIFVIQIPEDQVWGKISP